MKISRRSALAGTAGLAAAALLKTSDVAVALEPDPFIEFERRFDAAEQAYEKACAADLDGEELADAMHDIWDEITRTPARTVRGVVLKLRLLVRIVAVEEFGSIADAPRGWAPTQDEESGGHFLARTTLADAERLA